MGAGYKIPLGPKDSMLTVVNKNHNPGPGSYNTISGEHLMLYQNKTMGLPELAKPLYDNGVPGPGSYGAGPNLAIPSFKIVDESMPNDKLIKKILEQQGKPGIGP